MDYTWECFHNIWERWKYNQFLGYESLLRTLFFNYLDHRNSLWTLNRKNWTGSRSDQNLIRSIFSKGLPIWFKSSNRAINPILIFTNQNLWWPYLCSRNSFKHQKKFHQNLGLFRNHTNVIIQLKFSWKLPWAITQNINNLPKNFFQNYLYGFTFYRI